MTHMTWALIVTLIVYYSISLAIGLWGVRKQSASEYISAPRSTGFVVLTLTLLGTTVGGGMFLGVAEIGYGGGMTSFALGAGYLVGSAIMGLLAPTIRKICLERNVTTLFGVFDSLYPSQSRLSVSNLFTWTTFAVFVLMLTVQFLSVATFANFYIGINFGVGIMVVASLVAVISTLIYGAFGGFKRDMWTDVFQMSVISAGVILISSTIFSDRGLHAEISSLPSHFFTVGSNGILFFIGTLFFVAPTFLVRYDLWQRIMTAKTDETAKRAFITSGVVAFAFFAFFGFLGMYGKALGITNAKFVALEVIQRKMGGIEYALATAAFFAAVMSTADAFLGVTGLALAKVTIYRGTHTLESPGDNTEVVPKLRRVTLIVGAVSICLAYVVRDIVDVFAMVFGLLIVFVPALVGGLATKNPNESRAKWSILLGLVGVIAVIPFSAKVAYLPGFVISVLAYLRFREHKG